MLNYLDKHKSACSRVHNTVLDDRPNNIPANPSQVYKDKGWTSWGDWLGK